MTILDSLSITSRLETVSVKIPSYSRHSSGQARVRLGGQVFYLGKFGTTESKAEYSRLVGEFIATGGVVITEDAKADLTICEMFAAYLGWAKQNYGENATEFLKAKLIVKRTRTRYKGTEAANSSTSSSRLFGSRWSWKARREATSTSLPIGSLGSSSGRHLAD